MRTTRITLLATLLLLLAPLSNAQPAADYSKELLAIKLALLATPDKGDARIAALETLLTQSLALKKAHPGKADVLIWNGVVSAQLAGAKANMGSLALVKDTKADFEAAEKADKSAVDWSVYSLFGTLYAQVPGWPIGFGDKKVAHEMFKKSIALNPASAEPHFNYGQFLLGQEKYADATKELNIALAAPMRVGEKDLEPGAICNASRCRKYSDETDGRFRDSIRNMLERAAKQGGK